MEIIPENLIYRCRRGIEVRRQCANRKRERERERRAVSTTYLNGAHQSLVHFANTARSSQSLHPSKLLGYLQLSHTQPIPEKLRLQLEARTEWKNGSDLKSGMARFGGGMCTTRTTISSCNPRKAQSARPEAERMSLCHLI